MEHRGEILKNAIYLSGIPISLIAKRMGKSRRWFYLMFENQNVSLDTVLEIGKIIKHDFSTEIKEIRRNHIQEPENEYPDEENTLEFWRKKYILLLEEHNALLKSLKRNSK